MASEIADKSIRISIDRGGTFTDCHAAWPTPQGTDAELIVKLLSVDPGYEDAPREGVRRILEKVLQVELPRHEKLPTDKIDYIRLSTTVATNALLERRGARHALLITKGFRDLLLIGNQSRPRIFDLSISKPSVLYDAVVEVDERVTLVGYTSDPRARERAVKFDGDGNVVRGYDGEPADRMGGVVRGNSGEAVRILKTPDVDQVKAALEQLKRDGFESLAIVLMHSYTYPEHERLIGKIARQVGFNHISLSSELMPMIKIVARGTSSTADAYLTPVLQKYIDGFFDGFDPSLRQGVEALESACSPTHPPTSTASRPTRVEFMRSDGGLTPVTSFSGLHSILSGPAGGAVGCALTSYDPQEGTPVIGVDVGGTSSDLSRFDGRYEVVFETTTAGVTIQSPQLDINTVAAGGGSRLFWRNGLFVTGPESAGADPGPVCYRKGGPLAVTDANLVLGRLVPARFPSIFGPSEDQPLDVGASVKAFEALAESINVELGHASTGAAALSVDEIAWGFLQVANETMCRPIRALTEARGHATGRHVLAAFGGAGGQHACALAGALGIRRVLVHRYSSVLSAYGMALADRVVERQVPSAERWDGNGERVVEKQVLEQLDELDGEVRKVLSRQGFEDKRVKVEKYLNLRYDGTDTAIMVLDTGEDAFDYGKAFEKDYKQEFGFVLEGKDLIVDDIRVRGIGKSFDSLGKSVWEEAKETEFKPLGKEAASAKRDSTQSVYFDGSGRVETPVYLLGSLERGDAVVGPALIIDDTQTLVIDRSWEARVLEKHVLLQHAEAEQP